MRKNSVLASIVYVYHIYSFCGSHRHLAQACISLYRLVFGVSVNRFIFIETPQNREIVENWNICTQKPLERFTFKGLIVTIVVAEVIPALQELYKNSWRYSCMPTWYTIIYIVSTIFGVKLNYCNEVFICIVQSEVVVITPATASFLSSEAEKQGFTSLVQLHISGFFRKYPSALNRFVGSVINR